MHPDLVVVSMVLYFLVLTTDSCAMGGDSSGDVCGTIFWATFIPLDLVLLGLNSGWGKEGLGMNFLGVLKVVLCCG